MTQINIPVSLERIGELRRAFPEYIEAVLASVQERFIREGRALITTMLGRWQTGQLAETLKGDIIYNTLRFTIGPTSDKVTGYDYTKDVFFGAMEHMIYPKNVEALHWVRFGRDIYFKKVKHPGQKERPDILNALKALARKIVKEEAEALSTMLAMAG